MVSGFNPENGQPGAEGGHRSRRRDRGRGRPAGRSGEHAAAHHPRLQAGRRRSISTSCASARRRRSRSSSASRPSDRPPSRTTTTSAPDAVSNDVGARQYDKLGIAVAPVTPELAAAGQARGRVSRAASADHERVADAVRRSATLLPNEVILGDALSDEARHPHGRRPRSGALRRSRPAT